MNQLLVQYSYLQVLDFLTTVAFVLSGVKEGNPLVRMMMSVSPSAFVGLMLVKALAVLLGLYCWHVGRQRLLTRMNVMFAVLIAWNLTALILGTAARS